MSSKQNEMYCYRVLCTTTLLLVGSPYYAVRAYYANGPWPGYSGWDDYAERNAIKCTPGSMVKLNDEQMYLRQ